MGSSFEELLLLKGSHGLLPKASLLDIGKQPCQPAHVRLWVSSIAVATTRRKVPMSIVIVMKCKPNLPQIVGTFEPGRCRAHFLHSWQQETDQNCNYGDNHQQLYKSERR